jgi:type IV pilus assembly protein PilW
MTHRMRPRHIAGFGLLELMLAMGIGLIVIAGVLVIFLAQQQIYNNSSSQSLMQDADNAIAATIGPVARGVGFLGCGSISSQGSPYPLSSLPTPLTLNTTYAVQGYTGTLPTSIPDNAANVAASGDWSPALDSSITGDTAAGAEQGSDVLVMIGAAPFTRPIGVENAITTSTSALTVNDGTQLAAINSGGPQVVAVSDCSKSAVLGVAAVSGGTVTLQSTPSVGFNPGAQLIPLQQTMFFVGKGSGGQSGLFEGVMTIPAGKTASSATWTVTEMVPGVLAMKVLYGIGGNEAATEYVDASEVSNLGGVTTIKLAFLVEGGTGSATPPGGSSWSYKMFNGLYSLSVPTDTRMRHIYYMTINTRNATL